MAILYANPYLDITLLSVTSFATDRLRDVLCFQEGFLSRSVIVSL